MATDLLVILIVAVVQIVILMVGILSEIGTITLASGVIGVFNLGQTFNTHLITYQSGNTSVTLSQTDLNTISAMLAILAITSFLCLLWQLGWLNPPSETPRMSG